LSSIDVSSTRTLLNVQTLDSQDANIPADLHEEEEHEHAGEALANMSVGEKIAVLALVLFPMLGVIGAAFMLWGHGFGWAELSVTVALYVITALGITVGFHRQLTHGSFDSPRWVRVMWAIFGSMAAQGPVLTWVGVHRKHHQHSDHDGDPHSPHLHGSGVAAQVKGFFHAHVGWMFLPKPDTDRYIPDVTKDKALVWVDKLFIAWVALGMAIPAVIVGLVQQSWMGALSGLVWGGLVRICLLHHVTWSINSVCHVWGSRDYKSHDHSTNNWVFAILGMGEGWHNNHHAFPTSARHGLKWYQFDLSYVVIKAMSFVGLARKLRIPSQDRLDAKRAK
jgi:stearoyl-CoA desaturase (delta-9 desaturase)